MIYRSAIIAALAAIVGAAASAEPAADGWTVQPRWVAAHEAFLASDALQGRGSATRDEAIAAAYMASQFQGYGLTPAPGMGGYLQTATIIKPRLNGSATLMIGGAVVPALTLLTASTEGVHGKLTVSAVEKAGDLPTADVVLASSSAAFAGSIRAAWLKHIKLLIVRDGDQPQQMFKRSGGATSISAHLDGAPPLPWPAVVAGPGPAFDRLATEGGAEVS